MHAISVTPAGMECHITNNSTCERIFNLTEKKCNLHAKIIQLDYKTIQYGENNSTCIRRYHFVRYTVDECIVSVIVS